MPERERIVTFRLTPAEYADLVERARKDDRPVSSYIRLRVLPNPYKEGLQSDFD